MIFTSNLSTKERKEKEEDLRTLRYKLAISNTIFFFFFISVDVACGSVSDESI